MVKRIQTHIYAQNNGAGTGAMFIELLHKRDFFSLFGVDGIDWC